MEAVCLGFWEVDRIDRVDRVDRIDRGFDFVLIPEPLVKPQGALYMWDNGIMVLMRRRIGGGVCILYTCCAVVYVG